MQQCRKESHRRALFFRDPSAFRTEQGMLREDEIEQKIDHAAEHGHILRGIADLFPLSQNGPRPKAVDHERVMRVKWWAILGSNQ